MNLNKHLCVASGSRETAHFRDAPRREESEEDDLGGDSGGKAGSNSEPDCLAEGPSCLSTRRALV